MTNETPELTQKGDLGRATMIGLLMIGAFFALFAFFAFLFGLFEPENKPEPKSAEQIFRDRLSGGMSDCMSAVRQRSKFPTKAKLKPDVVDLLARIEAANLATKTFIYRGRVDLMNGFGAMIPHTYACTIDVPNWRFLNVSVTPG